MIRSVTSTPPPLVPIMVVPVSGVDVVVRPAGGPHTARPRRPTRGIEPPPRVAGLRFRITWTETLSGPGTASVSEYPSQSKANPWWRDCWGRGWRSVMVLRIDAPGCVHGERDLSDGHDHSSRPWHLSPEKGSAQKRARSQPETFSHPMEGRCSDTYPLIQIPYRKPGYILNNKQPISSQRGGKVGPSLSGPKPFWLPKNVPPPSLFIRLYAQ